MLIQEKPMIIQSPTSAKESSRATERMGLRASTASNEPK
jgi:hypothetical protein